MIFYLANTLKINNFAVQKFFFMPSNNNNKYCAEIFKVLAYIFAMVSMVLLDVRFGGHAVAQNKGEMYREAGKYMEQGGQNYGRGNFEYGITLFRKATETYKILNDTSRLIECYQVMGSGFQMTNNSNSSLYYYNKSLDLSIQYNDSASMSNCYMWLGSEAFNRSYTQLAEEYFLKASSIDSTLGEYGHLSQVLCRLGFVIVVYADSSKSEKDILTAKKYFTESLRLQTESKYTLISGIDARVGLATVFIDMADFYNEPRYADSCLHYYHLSLQSPGFGNYSHSLALRAYIDYLIYKKDFHAALDVMQKEQSFFGQSLIHSQSYHQILSKLYENVGDYRQALEHSRIVNSLQKQINSEGNTRAVAKAEAEKATAVEHANFEKAEAERKQLKTFVIALIGGLVLVSALVLLFFYVARVRRQANKDLSEKNTQLNSQKDEIAAQKDIILNQMHEVESINEKLFSSIDYARRIQRATVSSIAEIKALFSDSFLFFSPRDMVSGDFYRAMKCGRYSVMIIADCTGHGIPGAFLSMLGISALREYCSTEADAENPGAVLDDMRTFIKSTLSGGGQDGRFIDDGMDMTICCFDFEKNELRYATANQVAYIVRNGEIIKLKGDNMPIGHYVRERKHFMTLTTTVMKDDMLYMFTDGIQDQVGGPNQKRFMREKLLKIFTEIAQKPCDEQCETIENAILEWKGDNTQVDDMTMVGIRIP